jgi:Uma2 family endonuclease
MVCCSSFYTLGVRAVFVEVPQEILDHRRSTGIARYDEMWEGVLHMAPAPKINHQAIVAALIAALGYALRSSERVVVDGINLCDPTDVHGNYRVPDVCVLDPSVASVGDDFGRSAGVLLAIEVRSPREETYDKLDFYAARGVAELLIIDVHVGVVEHLELVDDRYTSVAMLDGQALLRDGVAVRLDSEGRVVVTWTDGAEQIV